MTPRARPVAVITGASRGLGASLARFLAAEGYDLVLVARGRPALEQFASDLEPAGTVRIVAGDVTEPETRSRVLAAVRELGRIDLLVNNAGVLGTVPLPPLVEYDLRELERVFAVNLAAPLALVQELRPELSAHRGRVINISSDAAVGGYPGWGAYGASKAALDLASLTLAHELAAEGISVLSVDPGDMLTPGVRAALPESEVSGRPPPEITLPFWAWLLHQDPERTSGHRFQAQADRWEVPP